MFRLHDNDVQKEGAGEIVRIKFLSEKQAKEIAELCGNTENGMKPIQDGVELVGFLRGTFPIEEKEAKVLLEYLDGHGYMLAGEGGRVRTLDCTVAICAKSQTAYAGRNIQSGMP